MPYYYGNAARAISDHKAGPDAPYFDSLSDLDNWAKHPNRRIDGVIGYQPRTELVSDSHQGKLLVCHDYKGGYTENPLAMTYTFNFWSSCDTFIYFSHHRVTVPPPGWITAAHRQGVKILGTLIFEGDGMQDCLRLLVGNLPKSKTGPAASATTTITLPLSPHYARLLADLAYHRGFDGYLLNFECPLQGGIEQTRNLAAWNILLQSELEKRIGGHAQTIWYDSVVFNGELRWQDRLNSLNLPFFLSSTSLFTNYTWRNHYPSLTAQYFLSLDPALLGKAKSLRDIFVGVDVWGRGQHGGGGFGSYRAISHIDPKFLGLSVALFGQAWTWETEQDKPGWDWAQWWAYERKLWVGPEDPLEVVVVPDSPPLKNGERDCEHGEFVPISSSFPHSPPPDPARLALHTTFSPGVGHAWYINGVRVMETQTGWTDIDKQGTLGDMLWPRPLVSWEGDERGEALPRARTDLRMDDAWNGGSCVRVGLSGPGSTDEDAFFRCVWIPVQSLSLTPGKSYEAKVVYKEAPGDGIDLDLGISVKLSTGVTIEVTPVSTEPLGGWIRQSVQFVCPSAEGNDIIASIGLVIGFAAEDPAQSFELSVLVGQLNIYRSVPSPSVSPHKAKIIWADFTPSENADSGLLTWEIAACFQPLKPAVITSPEDPIAAWTLDNSEGAHWFPSFVYFNIFAQVPSASGVFPTPITGASFVGTSGLSGYANELLVDRKLLPGDMATRDSVRFYVQGVTDRGEVLNWESCVYVDVQW